MGGYPYEVAGVVKVAAAVWTEACHQKYGAVVGWMSAGCFVVPVILVVMVILAVGR
jgi:hypothetical protein